MGFEKEKGGSSYFLRNLELNSCYALSHLVMRE